MTVKRSQFHQPSPAGRIAKGVLAALLPVLLLALAAPSKAQQLQQFSRNAGAEQSYDYLYVGFARANLTDVDGETPSGFGIELVGSKSFGDYFHVWETADAPALEPRKALMCPRHTPKSQKQSM